MTQGLEYDEMYPALPALLLLWVAEHIDNPSLDTIDATNAILSEQLIKATETYMVRINY